MYIIGVDGRVNPRKHKNARLKKGVMQEEFSEIMNRLSENARFALQKSDYYSKRYNNGYMSTEHLLLGIMSIDASTGAKMLRENGASLDAAFFLKPYPQARLFERIEWIGKHARYIGIDIDSYNILTMRNLVNIERKTAAQLEEFRKLSGVPFVIKGVFTDEDIELVKEVHPDVVYISNHGGRVETRKGSTADFLAAEGPKLKKYCDQIWVDGGIRTLRDIQAALYYGADQVIMARPLIRATFDGTYDSLISSYTSKNTLS